MTDRLRRVQVEDRLCRRAATWKRPGTVASGSSVPPQPHRPVAGSDAMLEEGEGKVVEVEWL